MVEGSYKKFKKHGKWIWYYSNGNKALEETYKNGSIVGESKFYSRKGGLLSKF